MGGGVVRLAGTGINAGKGALIVEQERLMAGVELHRLHRFEVSTGGLHESHCTINFRGHRFIATVGGVVGQKALIPRIYVPQVRKTTRGESTDQVQRRARYVVSLN